MKQVLTVSCKLNITPQQLPKIEETLNAFADACEYVNQTLDEKLTNEVAMQSLCYHDVRARFGLSAQLAIHAIRRVSGNRKTAKKDGKPVTGFAPTSATYDVRTFSFREKDWTVSLTLMGGRERFTLHIGNYQLGLLKGQKPKTATLSKRKDGSYYLNIQLESNPDKPQETDKVLGCDLGRTDICVTSENDTYSARRFGGKLPPKSSLGKQTTLIRAKSSGRKLPPRELCAKSLGRKLPSKELRDHYSNLRANLQQKASKGTRSSRRRCRELLKQLSGKEKRFQAHQNHTISYQLVKKAKAQNQVIALEDLTGIREHTNQLPRTKTERRRSNSWSFHQLRQFLIYYKCIKFAVKLVFVDPRYTSKTCHNCLHIHPVRDKSYRSGKSFRCGHCSWCGDADLNGSINISALGAVINQSRGSGLACSLEQHVLGLLKTPTSA
jgi:IS605 OrfB family transposase